MKVALKYNQKFITLEKLPTYQKLNSEQQAFAKDIAYEYLLTFQEFRQLIEISRDLSMWGEEELCDWWKQQKINPDKPKKQTKKILLSLLQTHFNHLRQQPKAYPSDPKAFKPIHKESQKIELKQTEKQISGMCPVASTKTVCCNLRTIDAVENCVFGCSYCTIQTFYQEKAVFDSNLEAKLNNIQIDPDRYYHFGTGQSSDSLVWGNKYGNLDSLCNFAKKYPNILVEFKTKSNNIQYFLDTPVPKNIVCSWSLNAPTIITNEEHFTANLEQRLEAARKVADQGIKVAFHFHPMVYFEGWEVEYPEVAKKVQEMFKPNEVLFLSFGSITMIKPVIQKIRNLGNPTKILQMDFVTDPHGKLTYPDEIKTAMFQKINQAFSSWKDLVFMYLCMEKEELWMDVFGFAYPTNEEFEKKFNTQSMEKVYSS
ncbi:MAG: spore photoproduct lyase [bacterium]|jgi:spore photoproduct lyase